MTAPLIEVTGLRRAFGDRTVLDGIDFTAERGCVTVVIGPSGSGKTTLLRGLNALDAPDAGQVRIGDAAVDFGALPSGRGEARRAIARLRAQSGMVFQNHNLFPHRTVLQNVTEGPVVVQGHARADAEREAKELLDRVGLAGTEDRFPFQLSGGQQQRVGIARALALHPEIVLFDEPTSALDPELVGEVLAVMKQLASEGWTMVVVTHEIRFARQVADQVLFLDGGVVAERGSAEQVLEHPTQERTQRFLTRILDPQ
ncbi:amino acid ABC transporter ATP-binding protein [Rhodococcoides corynebacterioides]|uniref:amino acid ABC transporter ATP-binding protein n=1 Tax=Rhodococcoides corynebacterioides TaxID=53972 RepID=UPI0027DF6642|nr:amino acid ABC transporter ATP-binding protein [Rhodococcus corynebacterioides]